MARDAWISVTADAPNQLGGCASGAELIVVDIPKTLPSPRK